MPPRSPLTEIIQRVQAKVDEVKAFPPDEYNLFLDLLLPEPEQVEKPKQTRKKRQAKGAGLPKVPESARCTVEGCSEIAGHPNHDKTYLSSHEFQSAPSSKKRSKSVVQSSETAKEPDFSSGVAA